MRSRFGCVLCRCGFYHYEHIDPPFEEAHAHEVEGICCLCGSCHDAVTRGRLSKERVADAYKQIAATDPEAVAMPVGPLDFHDGTAELAIGSLIYSPAVRTVLRYYGQDLIRVDPGEGGEPGRITAVFTNTGGEVVLRLAENEWIGSLTAWDIEVVGPRLTVRNALGELALRLRLDPPGRVVVERLDMRIGQVHLLVTEETYAVGRYLRSGEVNWIHALIQIHKSAPGGAAIEVTDVASLEARDALNVQGAQELADLKRDIVMNSAKGVMVKPLGLVIASDTGSFSLSEFCSGVQTVADMRRAVISARENLCEFMSTEH